MPIPTYYLMMKHKEIERLIQKRLDGELSPGDSVRLDRHMAQCSECALFFQEISQATRLVHRLSELHPQADFNARIFARLGLKRRFAWTRAAVVFVGSWLAAFLFVTNSSIPAQIFSRIATSIPALVRLYDKAEIVVSTLSQILVPVVKNSLNTMSPAIGLIFSILFIYILGKTLQKEAKCKA